MSDRGLHRPRASLALLAALAAFVVLLVAPLAGTASLHASLAGASVPDEAASAPTGVEHDALTAVLAPAARTVRLLLTPVLAVATLLTVAALASALPLVGRRTGRIATRPRTLRLAAAHGTRAPPFVCC